MTTGPSATEGREAHWRGVYSGRRVDRVSWYQARATPSLAMIEGARLGHSARILDVGGGTSHLVDDLLDAGYGAVGVLDIAPEALSVAQARLGERGRSVEWFTADVLDFRTPHPWDLWHDRAVFHFLVDPRDRQRYRDVLLASLAPAGQAVIATFGPEGPESCSGLPVARYDAGRLAAAVGPSLELVEQHLEDHMTPSGASQQFLFARFARTAKGGPGPDENRDRP